MSVNMVEAAPRWVKAFNDLAQYIEDWAERKGWNEDDPGKSYRSVTFEEPSADAPEIKNVKQVMTTYHDTAKLGLMMTEIAEAIEGLRHGDPPSDKIPQYTAQEEELADCIVRIMHYAAHRKLRVAEALVAKMVYNETRPYKHGKQA